MFKLKIVQTFKQQSNKLHLGGNVASFVIFYVVHYLKLSNNC